MPDLVERAQSFMLLVSEDQKESKSLQLAVELRAGVAAEAVEARERIFNRLREVNQEFRESIRMIPAGLEPTMAFHAAGTG